MNNFGMLRTAALALALGAGTAAQAVVTLVNPPTDGSYSTLPGPLSPGVYGVELRYGGAATWEVGVGKQTSVSGSFTQADQVWGAAGTLVPFTLTWNASTLSINLGGTTTSYAAPLLGNALRVSAKRDATVSLATVDGTSFATSVSGGTGTTNFITFYSNDGWGGDGLVATGTVRIGAAQGTGSSATEAFFQVGQFDPAAVPEPATWALLLTGFGMVGYASRRRSGMLIA